MASVLAAMNATPPREILASDISRAACQPKGSIGSTLRRMMELGWVETRSRKKRRVYWLTPEGARRADELGEASR